MRTTSITIVAFNFFILFLILDIENLTKMVYIMMPVSCQHMPGLCCFTTLHLSKVGVEDGTPATILFSLIP